MPAPVDPKPITWPLDLYRLIELGEGPPGHLATCVRHRGEHIYYLDGCHSLPPHARRSLSRQSRSEPEPTVRIEISNADELGEAIGSGLVLGFRRKRGEEDAEQDVRSAPAPTPPSTANTVRTIPVWAPDDSAE